MPSLAELAEFLDTTLNIAAVPDYPAAVNGVQLANVGAISRVATAVDFSSETVRGTIDAGANLLIVHHGMFWGGVQPLTGHRHKQLRELITHDVAVYSSHLPLAFLTIAKQIKAGTFKPGVIELGESSRVVMLVLNPTLAQRIPAAARTRIDSLQAQMLAGQLTISLDSLVNR